MRPLTESEIRASFANCSQGEARRANLPRDLDTLPWPDLDYLGWRDPKAPQRGYLVARHAERWCGLVLRGTSSGAATGRRSMCSLCATVRSGGVALMVAPRAGRAGQRGHTVGTYICADLACSLYLRGRLDTGGPVLPETLTLEQRVDRLDANLADFLARVLRSE
ncbi:MAG: FBP domain-containing protein [Nocardioides sp.]|uniref:FBP domain-containing protein n=1 Tax=Nocardioides sp. TaxID=35761 RepID=UPI0039E714ED